MILIALGSNLPSSVGSPRETLAQAVSLLSEYDIHVRRQSRLWLTAPVPVSDQNWFHNKVITVQPGRNAASLMGALHDIEVRFGRTRTVRNEARCLDLDLIAYNDQVQTDEENGPVLPHPRMHDRAFVLYPLKDIAPDWCHPLTGRSVDEMIDALPPGHQKDIKPLESTI